MSGVPPIIQAVLAMLLLIIGAAAIYLCAVLADSPIARHFLGLCNFGACRRCEDEARQERVEQYAKDLREREARRAA